MFSRKLKSTSRNQFSHSEGTAVSQLIPGQLGKARFDGVYYSRVLLMNSQFAAPKGAGLRFLRMKDSTTALVEPLPAKPTMAVGLLASAA